MLEPLAGRLKWERTPLGILVAIPSRRGAMSALYGPLIGIWLIIAGIHYWSLVGGGTPSDESQSSLQGIAIVGYVVGFLVILCWLMWAFTSETILHLDANEMRLQRRIIGIDLFTRSFQNSEVEQIRYVAPSHAATSKSITDPNTSKIQFVAKGVPQVFGQGISELEARALIERMLDVYTFPKSAYLQAPHLHGDW